MKNIKEYENIKDMVIDVSSKRRNQTIFIKKYKEEKETRYENITYDKLLKDIQAFGTDLYKLGLKDKRVAVIGRNRYDWNMRCFAYTNSILILFNNKSIGSMA